MAFALNSRVDALYDRNADDVWYPGRITKVHLGDRTGGGQSYDIHYDDGEMEFNIEPEFIRQHVKGTISAGTRVLGNYCGDGEWYPGQIAEVLDNGCFTIYYDDAEVETNVPFEYVKEEIYANSEHEVFAQREQETVKLSDQEIINMELPIEDAGQSHNSMKDAGLDEPVNRTTGNKTADGQTQQSFTTHSQRKIEQEVITSDSTEGKLLGIVGQSQNETRQDALMSDASNQMLVEPTTSQNEVPDTLMSHLMSQQTDKSAIHHREEALEKSAPNNDKKILLSDAGTIHRESPKDSTIGNPTTRERVESTTTEHCLQETFVNTIAGLSEKVSVKPRDIRQSAQYDKDNNDTYNFAPGDNKRSTTVKEVQEQSCTANMSTSLATPKAQSSSQQFLEKACLLPNFQRQYSHPNQNEAPTIESMAPLDKTNVMLASATNVVSNDTKIGASATLEDYSVDENKAKELLASLVKYTRSNLARIASVFVAQDGIGTILGLLRQHSRNAVIQSYIFVLTRRLGFVSTEIVHLLLSGGIVGGIVQAMQLFTDDAILQASACGALTALVQTSDDALPLFYDWHVTPLVFTTLVTHKRYSVYTRQVQCYIPELFLKLCELGDYECRALLTGNSLETQDIERCPIAVCALLLNQALFHEDRKVCCAVAALLLYLAHADKAFGLILIRLNAISDLSAVITKYPKEPVIERYASAGYKAIGLCSQMMTPQHLEEDELDHFWTYEKAPKNRQETWTSSCTNDSYRIKSSSKLRMNHQPQPTHSASTKRTTPRTSQSYYDDTHPIERQTQKFISSPYGKYITSGDTSSRGRPVRNTKAKTISSRPVSPYQELSSTMDANDGQRRREQEILQQNVLIKSHSASAESSRHHNHQMMQAASHNTMDRRTPRDSNMKNSAPPSRKLEQSRDVTKRSAWSAETRFKERRSPPTLSKESYDTRGLRNTWEKEYQVNVKPTKYSSPEKTIKKATAQAKSLTSFASELFSEELTGVDGIDKASSVSRGEEKKRLAFADKLHKMIEETKSMG